MAHLSVVESWVGAMSGLLPRAIEEAGHHFTFRTSDLHHRTARSVVTAPTSDAESALPRVERSHGASRFEGAVTSCARSLPAAARIAARPGLPEPSAEAMENARRKHATRRVLAAARIPGPRSAVCADGTETVLAAHGIGHPLAVEPMDLCEGTSVRQIDVALAPCGGVRAALRIVAPAKGSGTDLMPGRPTAGTLGIAPAVHTVGRARRTGLDGHLLLAHGPWSGIGGEDGRVAAASPPQLGVRPRSEAGVRSAAA
ncbi:hypothetical protein ACFYSH_08675 [Streptomyces sp. NPDC005791]|uniref:hypothetical protein n=1 Tax=Streptomyces sp. NPDC005791 TaxID=3364732 RepID=UPI00367A0570